MWWRPGLTLGVALVSACSSAGGGADAVARRDARAGQLLLEQYDCGRCHVIPGVRRAQGVMGPALTGFARQAYIAGEIPNDTERLVRWIQSPQQLVPDTLMPSQDVPAQRARQMAAYLGTLR